MAKKQGVWGIDIGLVAIKALRCIPGDSPRDLVADRFDYIEYPKMLNQPEAEPEAMVREALQQFLSRNDVKGDKVAISVAGQSGLSRFFRPPPVEAHTLPDIVKYEVKQQIPFPIEDVIWDWQQLGGTVVDDRIVDAEVGLFAMKREAVFRALKPFDDAGVEVDLVQLSPLAVYNYVTHDVLDTIPDASELDPENPPDSVVVISMGTDTTDLVVTNGIKLWMRNIPVGGNHFTKQLSRELTLTHAKAEQLKRNARQAEDPKQLFKAMRPVFTDFVNEVQRSLAFFQGLEKNARISRIVLLGNSANLPGLRQFLNQQLELDIVKVGDFRHLKGSEVLSEKSFQENSLSFAPAYGLCLQALNMARLKTNLLPTEIQTERIIRAKKPWVLASLALLMLGMLVGYYFKQVARYGVSDEYRGADSDVTWKRAKDDGQTKVSLSRSLMDADKAQKASLEKLNKLATELSASAEKKATWIEFTSALTQALPKDPRIARAEPVDANEVPYEDRQVLYIDHMETVFDKQLENWHKTVKPIYDSQFENKSIDELVGAAASTAAESEAPKANPNFKDGKVVVPEPTNLNSAAAGNPDGVVGAGYVIELRGHHYHNSDKAAIARDAGKSFLLRTLIDKMVNGELELPGSEEEGGGKFKYSDFGILLPTIVQRSGMPELQTITLDAVENPNAALLESGKSGGEAAGEKGGEVKPGDGASSGAPNQGRGGEQAGGQGPVPPPAGGSEKPAAAQDKLKNEFKVRRFNFIVQMAWIPRTPAERVKARADRLAKEQAAAAAAASGGTEAGAAGADGGAPVPTPAPGAPAGTAPAAPPAAPAAGSDDD
ncbi:MAG: type IV pilus assembly protein PilM [Planctomycetota bacterium]